MSTNNISDISFQTVDTSTIEDSTAVLAQSGSQSQQTSNADLVSLQTPSTVETVTVSTPVVTTSNNISLHSILTNNTTTATNTLTSTTIPVASSNQNHVTQVTSNHTPKGTQPVASSGQAANTSHDQILTKTRLQDLVKEIDSCEQLDEEVEDLLLQLVDDFVTSTVNTACVFAKHRNANTVEVKDVQLYLEKTYNMWIPGFGTEEVKPYKKPPITEAHKQRLALIRKSLRKY